MVHRVLRTLLRAALTRVGAKRTYRVQVFVAPRDRRGGKAANIGAFHVQHDAVRHRFRIALFKASGGALKASRRTFIARAEALTLFLAKHLNILKSAGILQLIIAILARAVSAVTYSETIKANCHRNGIGLAASIA